MVAPTCFGITLPSSGSVPSAFWEMLNWGSVDRILWMGVLCLVTWCVAIWDRIFSVGILIFKELTARRFYKSFGVKGISLRSLVCCDSGLESRPGHGCLSVVSVVLLSGSGLSVVSVVLLSGSGLYDWSITRPEKSYRVCICVSLSVI
jgi:hypothetical protein